MDKEIIHTSLREILPEEEGLLRHGTLSNTCFSIGLTTRDVYSINSTFWSELNSWMRR